MPRNSLNARVPAYKKAFSSGELKKTYPDLVGIVQNLRTGITGVVTNFTSKPILQSKAVVGLTHAKACVRLFASLFALEIMMSSSIETLEAEALQLPLSQRAHLVERLIASLDVDPEVEDAWALEVARRLIEIESGAATLLLGAETLDKLKAEFQ